MVGINGEERSSVKRKTLFPRWNEQFALPVDAGARDVLTLRVRCEDSDEVSANDSMGLVDLPLAHLAHKRRQRGWHALGPDAERKSGKVPLSLPLSLSLGSSASREAWTFRAFPNKRDQKRQKFPVCFSESVYFVCVSYQVSGALELVLRWRFNPELEFEPFGDCEDFPDKDPNELLIALVRGRDLVLTQAARPTRTFQTRL